jgi:hypothetical protein
MRIRITKGAGADRVTLERADGSRAEFGFPKKGPYPHDAYHFFVERELGMAAGFWGLVAGGMAPDNVQTMALAGGHASAKRAGVPDAGLVQLIQAERLVECFEAASWGGGADDASIMAMAEPGWTAGHVPPPEGVSDKLGAIRAGLDPFLAAWEALPEGGALTLDWPPHLETRA